MDLFLGVTDHDWFRYLKARQPEEVNFWQPGGGRRFRALEPGGLFLFKLKAPHNAIGGGGFFVRHAQIDAHTAWETFGAKNGAPDYWTFLDRLQRLRQGANVSPNPEIGCIVLAQPFFLDREDWIDLPESWKPQIVSGKGYDTRTDEGRRLWHAVQERLSATISPMPGIVADEPARYGQQIVRRRLGQGAFRLVVTEAYDRRCVFSGERTLPALQAAHIKPYAASGPHRVQNGLLLRADLHQLFDAGYLTVAPERRVEVSSRIREEFDNGRDYYALHGQELRRPVNAVDGPDATFLAYHNEHVYRP